MIYSELAFRQGDYELTKPMRYGPVHWRRAVDGPRRGYRMQAETNVPSATDSS